MTYETILTGDRPTGPLHIGHLLGSLRERVRLQHAHESFIMIADMQALTDNAGRPSYVADHVREVFIDYLASGICSRSSVIFRQSDIPELCGLTCLYMNLVSTARLERNPTIRAEIESRGFGASVPAGFLAYPISQAADITAFDATLVPAGEDQAPLIELSNEIVAKVNHLAGQEIIRKSRLHLSSTPRLPGTDGTGKMSKSSGNAIYLGDTADVLRAKVMGMFTDPQHLRASDPGRVEGNPVFCYLDAFHPDVSAVDELKAHYRKGGLGDVALKRILLEVMEEALRPIRKRRAAFSADPGEIDRMIAEGADRARGRAARSPSRVRSAFGLRAF